MSIERVFLNLKLKSPIYRKYFINNNFISLMFYKYQYKNELAFKNTSFSIYCLGKTPTGMLE